MSEIVAVTLANVADGAAAELWQKAVSQILENIEDPNTDATVKRVITLKCVVTPDGERRVGDMDISCVTRLASAKGVKTIVFFGRHKGERVAVEQPRQQDLFPAPSKATLAAVADRKE